MCSNSTTFTAIFVKLISTFINTQILHLHLTKESTNLQQFCPEILHSTTFFSKNSTSTNTLNFYNSTIFFWSFSTFYNDFLGQIYNLHLPPPPPPWYILPLHGVTKLRWSHKALDDHTWWFKVGFWWFIRMALEIFSSFIYGKVKTKKLIYDPKFVCSHRPMSHHKIHFHLIILPKLSKFFFGHISLWFILAVQYLKIF